MPPKAGKTAGSAAGGGGGERLSGPALKYDWGLDGFGTVDAGEAFDALWPFVPQNIRVRARRSAGAHPHVLWRLPDRCTDLPDTRRPTFIYT